MDNKRLQKIKKLYEKSIFVDNLDEILNADDYFNRYDEWILKKIGVGYLMMALDGHPEIEKKLSKKNINDLIYSIACYMDSTCITEAIEESNKYNLSV